MTTFKKHHPCGLPLSPPRTGLCQPQNLCDDCKMLISGNAPKLELPGPIQLEAEG